MPRVLAADDSRTLIGQNVLVLSRLEGAHVWSLLDRLSDAELAAVNRQIGAALRSLHEVNFERFRYAGADGIVEPHETNAAYMRVQFAKTLRELTALGGDPELRRAVERHVAERAELLAGCERPALCRDDCHYGNVLVLPASGGWRVCGLLDFENAVAGDPLLDLAKAHCSSPRRSEALLAALAAGYGELRPDWREALDLYVLYHWLELWDRLASLGRAEALAGIAEEMRDLTGRA